MGNNPENDPNTQHPDDHRRYVMPIYEPPAGQGQRLRFDGLPSYGSRPDSPSLPSSDRPSVPYSQADSQSHATHTTYPPSPPARHQDPQRCLPPPLHPPCAESRDPPIQEHPCDETIRQRRQDRPSLMDNGIEHASEIPADSNRHLMPPYPPMAPGLYQTQSHPPPPPQQTHTPQAPMVIYGLPPGHSPPNTSRDPSNNVLPQYASYPANHGKRKLQRAAQACDSCRSLKAKCDELKPCTSCLEKDVPCNYRESPPKQQDKSQEQLLEAINAMTSEFRSYTQRQEERQKGIELQLRDVRELFKGNGYTESKASNGAAVDFKKEDSRNDAKSRGITPPALHSEPHSFQSNTSPDFTPIQDPVSAPMEYSEEEDQGDPEPPGPAMPVNHTTGAARLLLVGPVAEMTRGVNIGNRINFPLVQEGRRVLLANTEEWGQISGLTLPRNVERGGFDANGMPDFRKETVDDLIESYMKNINTMHPLITERTRRSLVASFLESLVDAQPKHRQMAAEDSIPENRRSKRKRSRNRSSEPLEPLYCYRNTTNPGHPPRTISTAIVLTMLALGSICKHKEKIQDDCIPGLQYFVMAADIIGNQLPGNTLQHVHAGLMASLYYGQLGRVIESWAYLANACRALLFEIQSHLHRWGKMMAKEPRDRETVPAEDNPFLFAFWTCLQLESDILAELPVEHTGILKHEARIPWPNMAQAKEDGFDKFILESYSAQLFLRKHLNKLHTMFYPPETDAAPGLQPPPAALNIDIMAETLEDLRRNVPERFKWENGDEPAKNILVARLRAKYYGARVITFRYFVLKILENSAARSSQQGQKISDTFRTGVEVPHINKNATSIEQISDKVLEYVHCCIDALIESTKAFDHVVDITKERLIVTNPWGTAHAQWGNVLTLQAVYRDPILNSLIDKQELTYLLNRTIRFLSIIAQPLSALQSDILILKYAGEKNGLILGRSGGGSLGIPKSGKEVIMTGL